MFGMNKNIAQKKKTRNQFIGMSRTFYEDVDDDDVKTGVRDRSCSSRYCVNCARFFLLKCDIIVTNAIRCFVVYIYMKIKKFHKKYLSYFYYILSNPLID